MKVLAVCLSVLGSLALSTEANAQDRSDACGYVYPVAGYQAEIGGLRISLPENDRLIVNDRVLAEHTRYDEPGTPEAWVDSANSAKVAQTRDCVLVLTMWTDCVDYAWSRIYVLDREGELRTTSALWSVHYPFSFIQTRAGLVFSSDWFCVQTDVPAGRAYTYILRRGESEFVREEHAREDVCDGERHRGMSSVFFANMQPVLPVH